jgi:hypothetical protein
VQLSDPHAFASQLPMYEVKVGYVLLLRLLAGLTGTIGAVQLLDFLGTALATVTLFLACRCLPGTLGLVWVPLALLLPVVPLARLATPDALCVGLYGAGFLLLTRERIAAGLALALLGLSMRPDNVVLNAVLSGALLLLGRTRAAAAFGLASAGLYALAIRLSGYIGWWKHFSVSMVAAQPDLRGFEPAFSPYQYAKAIYRVFDWFLLVEPWGTLVVLAALLAFHLTRGREEEMRLERALLSALLLAFGVRLLIFPIPEFRPYAPILIGVYLCLLSTGRKSLSRTAGGSRP